MPMFTMLRIGLPVWPVHSPERIRSAKARIRPSTSCTSGTTFAPSVSITAPAGARSATCSTARSSVMLMCSPPNISARSSASPDSRARSTSRPMVSAVTRCLE